MEGKKTEKQTNSEAKYKTLPKALEPILEPAVMINQKNKKNSKSKY